MESLEDLYSYKNTCSFYAQGRPPEPSSPSEGSPRALGELRRVKGFRKKSLSEAQKSSRKISSMIKVLIHLIIFHKISIIRKRVFESITVIIHSIIILCVKRKK